jgi:hypothetical protein
MLVTFSAFPGKPPCWGLILVNSMTLLGQLTWHGQIPNHITAVDLADRRHKGVLPV